MTMRAVGFQASSAALVLCECHGFKVRWIHTSRIAAKMVNSQSIWYWADQKLVGEAMGLKTFRREVELPVTTASFGGLPFPAATGHSDYLRPETSEESIIRLHREPSFLGAMWPEANTLAATSILPHVLRRA